MTALLVALAGGVGAAARFGVDTAIGRALPTAFPWGIVLVNLSGSFLLGVLTGAAAAGAVAPTTLTVLGIGFCGGYTTFGTAMVETLRLLERRAVLVAVGHHVLVAAACVALAAVGYLLGSV